MPTSSGANNFSLRKNKMAEWVHILIDYFFEKYLIIFLINNIIVLHEQKQIMLGGWKNKEK